jgi:hypothetical protein
MISHVHLLLFSLYSTLKAKEKKTSVNRKQALSNKLETIPGQHTLEAIYIV